MTPYFARNKPGKMIRPSKKCPICNKDYLNARAMIQHKQLVHGYKYDHKG